MEYHFLFLLPPLLSTIKTIQNGHPTISALIQLRSVSTSTEDKQHYLTDIILHCWTSLLKLICTFIMSDFKSNIKVCTFAPQDHSTLLVSASDTLHEKEVFQVA